MKQEFYFTSADGKTPIHCVWWKPEGEVRAVLQLVHGMVEHIGRYEEFALYLNQQGIAVLGYDQLGHGDSVLTEADRGYFADRGGMNLLLRDAHTVTKYARKAYPGRKVFLMGHSFGSFLVRRYATVWGQDIDGLIVMGTGAHTVGETAAGRMLSRLLCRVKGSRYRSVLLTLTGTGGYELTYRLKGGGSWLSRNNESVEAYKKDPRCDFIWTASAFHTLFQLVEDATLRKDQERIPATLPVLFVSGMEDMVGACTKGVLKAYNDLVLRGMEDLDIKFYENDRHELLQEPDRDIVFADLLHWIEVRL